MRLADDPEIRAIQAEVQRFEAAMPPLATDMAMLERIGGLGRIKLRDLRAMGPGDRRTTQEARRTPPIPQDHEIVEDWSEPVASLKDLDPLPRSIPAHNRKMLYAGCTARFGAEIHRIRFDPVLESFDPCSCEQPLHFEGFAIRHGSGPQIPSDLAA